MANGGIDFRHSAYVTGADSGERSGVYSRTCGLPFDRVVIIVTFVVRPRSPSLVVSQLIARSPLRTSGANVLNGAVVSAGQADRTKHAPLARHLFACRSVLVPGEGIKPPTYDLQGRCSTAELTRHVVGRVGATPAVCVPRPFSSVGPLGAGRVTHASACRSNHPGK
jgi:hypothetical protein